jgi:hypothetical protein
MYTHVKDNDYEKAVDRQIQVIGGYRNSEAKKLRAYGEREVKRRPVNDEHLKSLIASRTSRVDRPSDQEDLAVPSTSGRGRDTPPGSRDPSRERKRHKQGPKPCGGNTKRDPTPPGGSGGAATVQAPKEKMGTKGKYAYQVNNKGKATAGQPSKGSQKNKGKKPYMPKGQPAANEQQLLHLLCKAWLEKSSKK